MRSYRNTGRCRKEWCSWDITAPGKRCKKEVWGCKEGPHTVVWSCCRFSLCHKMMCAQHGAQTTEPASTDSSQPSVSFSNHAERDGGTQPGSQSAQEFMGTVVLPLCQTCTQLHTQKGQGQWGWCLGSHNYSLVTWCQCNSAFGPSFAHRKQDTRSFVSK